jgi:sulfofructose kinase
MAKVVCVGISVFDYVFGVERLPEAHIKHYALGRREVTGGIAANAARAVVRLGGRAALVSRVGDDLPGRAARADLAGEGVELGGLHAMAGVRTSLSAVIVDASGERMLVNDTDPRALLGLEGVPPGVFEGADAVLADTRWADGAALAVRTARERGVPGVLDFDRVPDHGGTKRCSRRPATSSSAARACWGSPGPPTSTPACAAPGALPGRLAGRDRRGGGGVLARRRREARAPRGSPDRGGRHTGRG